MSIYGFGAVSMALQSEVFSLSKDNPPPLERWSVSVDSLNL